MQQKLTQRMTRLLAAAGAALLLTQAAWAAAYEVPWDETCQLHSEDFTAGQTVDPRRQTAAFATAVEHCVPVMCSRPAHWMPLRSAPPPSATVSSP